ncbi:MAG: hypothetical protein V1701_05130 [Planctomycetota bacterium]
MKPETKTTVNKVLIAANLVFCISSIVVILNVANGLKYIFNTLSVSPPQTTLVTFILAEHLGLMILGILIYLGLQFLLWNKTILFIFNIISAVILFLAYSAIWFSMFFPTYQMLTYRA